MWTAKCLRFKRAARLREGGKQHGVEMSPLEIAFTASKHKDDPGVLSKEV